MKFKKVVEGIKCNICLREIENDWEEHIRIGNDYHECKKCSYISGKIDESTYLKWAGETASNAHAAVKDGVVIVWYGGATPPWMRKRRK